ncbi:hypothetical protein [Streptomyces sp. NPDC052107]|uniref:hypothetical protein n=1 Tax=Streptomyces sp. NPDC052107 TaxID=3155632 RepID=UPI003448CF76
MSTPPWAQQPGQPQQPFPAQAPVPPKKSKAKTCAGAGCLGVVAVLVLGGAITAAGGGKSADTDKPAAAPSHANNGAKTAAPHSAGPKQTPQTVTYVVTGTSGADVQYGPAGSSAQGTVPMHVTKPLKNPQYYSITTQLQGAGHVTCQLKVNGKVISQSTASGGYNIASCEISKDLFGDKWTDTNAG